MKTITLGELLTEEQGKEVMHILATSEDLDEQIVRLKGYLSKFKEQLEAKGVIPEYLACCIPYFVKNPVMQMQSDLSVPSANGPPSS